MRKPKRAESEIPSLPEAGPAELSFERQNGKINGHLLREPRGHSVLLPHGQTATRAVLCCCRTVYFGRVFFQACAVTKISAFSPLCLHRAQLSKSCYCPFPDQHLCRKHIYPPLQPSSHKLTLCITEPGGWCDPQLNEHLSRCERREDFCTGVFIFPPSQHHGDQSDSAKVGPPHKFRTL